MTNQPRDEKAIFLAALEQATPDARNAYLEGACAGDADLRRRVSVLLEAHQASLGPLDRPAPEFVPTITERPLSESAGTVIGPYKLLQQIGEGGMGVVYMAEQTEPVERRVALKIIKPGMDTRQVIARFEAERQALAMMDHPNIARVLDAGTTDEGRESRVKGQETLDPQLLTLGPSLGRPYFVMELVKGLPITQYCDEHQLTPRERLELFLPVCQAVQHAHQKGIIHRDLKPSNILVSEYDDRPVPKVIDFGVAKAVSQRLTEKTMFTHYGQIVGTLEYMSPEQAKLNELDVDTRSDVYALGVLLYELLTGATPLDKQRLKTAAFDEILRMIREEEPQKPSTRLSTAETLPSIAANRKTEPRKLSGVLRGDLDWIVMKALEKDRSRRYETANGLAADVLRYLADEPVSACPPSAAYRFRKFARRNRGLLTSAVVVAVALVTGTAVSTWQAVRAIQAEESARQEAAIAQAVISFLNDDLLAQGETFRQPDPDVRLRTVVERAAARITGRFPDQPLVEAAVRHTLARVFGTLGEIRQSEEQARRAFELRRKVLGDGHAATLESKDLLAGSLWDLDRYDEARSMSREVIAAREQLLGPEHRLTLQSRGALAVGLRYQGELAEAETVLRDVFAVQQRVLGATHADTLKVANDLAQTLADQTKFTEAAALLRETLTRQTQVLGREDPQTLGSMSDLGQLLRQQGKMREARTLLQETLAIQERVLGDEHPNSLRTRSELAYILVGEGEYAAAESELTDVLAIERRILPVPHFNTLVTMSHLAAALRLQGKIDPAEPLLREALAGREQLLGARHKVTLEGMCELAIILDCQGHHDDAEQMLRRCADLQREVLGGRSAATLQTMYHLAVVLGTQGKFAEAEALLPQIIDGQSQVLGAEDPQTLMSRGFRAQVLLDLRRPAEAEREARDVVDAFERIGWETNPFVQHGLIPLSGALSAQQRHAEAETVLRRIAALRERVYGAGHRSTLDARNDEVRALARQSKLDEAESLLEQIVPVAIESLGPEDPDTRLYCDNLRKIQTHRQQSDLLLPPPPPSATPGTD